MLVVGGSYGERCVNPERDTLAGSGQRAAAILRSAGADIKLISACDERTADLYQAAAAGYGVDVDWLTRSGPVGFDYFTPVSTPAITGRGSRLIETGKVLEAHAALVFGMVETRPAVRAGSIVIDPQQPRELDRLDLDGIEADRIAVVLNSSETAAISGCADPLAGARALLESCPVDVVVTKRGTRGAVVTTASGQRPVSPRRTSVVWPIGSGDAFAAGFAHAWAVEGRDPVEAAEAGSRVAAHWCSTESYATPFEVLAGTEDVAPSVPVNDARVYLAAPFFTLGERWLVDLCRAALRPHVFSPLHDVGRRGATDGASEIAGADLDGLRACHAVLALIDRSDPGTIFEAGWATHAGLPVVAYGEQVHESAETMLGGTSAELIADLATAIYHAAWNAMAHADA
jgi:sugar/nucleoside kinase (ribokinase family)/nucleoside 2-deoxyribosyltransferase